MFTGELAESRATEVTIRDVDEQAMEQLVEFCYTAHIVVEESNVQVLLVAYITHTTYARRPINQPGTVLDKDPFG